MSHWDGWSGITSIIPRGKLKKKRKTDGLVPPPFSALHRKMGDEVSYHCNTEQNPLLSTEPVFSHDWIFIQSVVCAP